jgi:hypothetical protein
MAVIGVIVVFGGGNSWVTQPRSHVMALFFMVARRIYPCRMPIGCFE